MGSLTTFVGGGTHFLELARGRVDIGVFLSAGRLLQRLARTADDERCWYLPIVIAFIRLFLEVLATM